MRFVTANGELLWAAVEPDTRCDGPKVCSRSFEAILAPFASEEAATEALRHAGGLIDDIKPLPQPGRQP